MKSLMFSLLTIGQIFYSTTAFAKTESVSKISFKDGLVKVSAELFYDKESKKADLWVDFFKGPDDKPLAFKATSLADRYKDASHKLLSEPLAKIEDKTVLIFRGFEIKTDEYDGNRGFALIFRCPISQLLKADREYLYKNFPNSVARDENGTPTHIKALLSRVTEFQAAPLAAFDVELDLEEIPLN